MKFLLFQNHLIIYKYFMINLQKPKKIFKQLRPVNKQWLRIRIQKCQCQKMWMKSNLIDLQTWCSASLYLMNLPKRKLLFMKAAMDIFWYFFSIYDFISWVPRAVYFVYPRSMMSYNIWHYNHPTIISTTHLSYPIGLFADYPLYFL